MVHDPLIAELEIWLMGQALDDPAIADFFPALCDRLLAAGLPLDRAMLSWPTLHPLHHSEQLVWRPGAPLDARNFSHAVGHAEAFLKSALHFVIRNRLNSLRRRLTGPEALLDFDFLRELRDEGYADYLVVGANFHLGDLRTIEGADRSGMVGSWATRRPGGFSDGDISALIRLMRPYAVAVRATLLSRLTNNFADAYLGPAIGRKVLAGAIRLGDGERIRALVWFSDLRGSTRLSQEMAPGAYLELLNRYFEATAQPVLDAGGQVLAFLGDGVLAVFPLGAAPRDAVRDAGRALDEALARVAAANAAAPPGQPPIAFGVGLAIGDVLLGNIGVAQRLSFTVIGETVNAVTRIERHTKVVGRTVLATADVASADPEGWRSIGAVELPDIARPQELFRRAR